MWGAARTLTARTLALARVTAWGADTEGLHAAVGPTLTGLVHRGDRKLDLSGDRDAVGRKAGTKIKREADLVTGTRRRIVGSVMERKQPVVELV